MSMVVKNNMSAVNALNTLNKNSSEMANALKKVSSGMKVNGAGDDASAYSISEKMRVRIRSLGQCESNTETGKSMLKVAEGAVNEQVQIAWKLKESALKSANDTCSDDDRQVLQRETTQMLMQLNEISWETNYNGMQLLTGRELGTVTAYFDPNAPRKDNNPGVNIFPTPNGGISNSSTGSIAGYTPGGTSNPSSSYDLNLSGLSSLNLPADLNGQGFSILCSACGQFNSIKFDTGMAAGTGVHYSSSGSADAFVVGVNGVTSTSALETAIFDGIRAALGLPPGTTSLPIGSHSTTLSEKQPAGSGYVLTRDTASSYSHFVLYNGFKGDLVTTESYHPWGNFYIQGDTKSSQETRLQFPNTTLNMLFPSANSDWQIDPAPSDIPTEWPSDFMVEGSAEFEYYDKKYNCNGNFNQIRLKKWEDEVWPYPRRGALASGSCVMTKENANRFMGDVENALKYLLHAATTLGSQCQRMDVMNSNLVTSDESTQASESLIRDADMAKEMVNYTKQNVLSQTAQSALSQANQTSSGVLNLLQ